MTKITGFCVENSAFPLQVEVISVPFLSLRMRWIPNTGQLLEYQRHINVSNYVFHPCMVLLASKAAFACVLFMAQPGHNSRGSVLPQLGPLCSTIHSRVSWVRWPEPSWILSLGFIGWHLIYPLYTFQIIGLSLQGRKRATERKNMLWVFCPSPRGRLHQTPPNIASTCTFREPRKRSITATSWPPKQPLHPGFPLEARCRAHCCFIFIQPTAVHPGRPNLRYCQPVGTGCCGNESRSVGTLQHTSCVTVPVT